MTTEAELNLLIDRASSIAGSDYKLAQKLGVGRQVVSNWRHGRKTATPEDQALMAAIAGLDATQVLARAMVKKHEGTPKGDMLMRALGKALLVTGAAIGSAGVRAQPIFGLMHEASSYFVRCIKGWIHRRNSTYKAPSLYTM